MFKDGTNKDYNCLCIYIPKKITPHVVLKAGVVSQTGWCDFLQENKIILWSGFLKKKFKIYIFQ